jgi:hypothetical protein
VTVDNTGNGGFLCFGNGLEDTGFPLIILLVLSLLVYYIGGKNR